MTQPFGDAVGSELDALFAGLNRKRRASGAIANANKEARVDDAFGAPTPGGPGLTSAFQFDDDNIDYGQDYNDDTADFNQDAFNRFNSVCHKACSIHSKLISSFRWRAMNPS